MNPRDFLTLAKSLTSKTGAENYRSAISRAYYAAHLVAKDFLFNFGIRIKKSGSGHGEATKCIGNSGDLAIEKAGSKLGDLQGMRIKADYHMDNTEVEKNSIAILQTKIASSIIEEFDMCMADKTRIDAIKPPITSFYKKYINPL